LRRAFDGVWPVASFVLGRRANLGYGQDFSYARVKAASVLEARVRACFA
jgi:hypothetical protein